VASTAPSVFAQNALRERCSPSPAVSYTSRKIMALDDELEQQNEDLEGDLLPDLDLPLAEKDDGRKIINTSLYARNVIRAHTVLLDHEVVASAVDIEAFRQVRMHFVELERWHETHTGWRIQRSTNFYRLERHPYGVAAVASDEKLKRPRDFACLAWVLWFAEKRYLAGGGRNQQFLLSQLSEEIQEQSRLMDAMRRLDFRSQSDRFSIWRTLDYLTRLGAVQSIEGDARRWVDDAEQQDNEVLYEFTAIAHSLVEALHETEVAAVAERLRDPAARLQPGRMSGFADLIPLLNRAWCALLLGPIFLRYDDPEAFAVLVQRAETVSEDLAESFGWQLELNNDYACIVRGGNLSASSGPGLSLSSAQDQMILLLCSAIRQRVEAGEWLPDGYGCLRQARGDIEQLFSELRQRFGMHWGATAQQSKATDLLEEMYQKMRLLGLLRGPDADGDLLILPTVARYAVEYMEGSSESTSRPRTTREKKPKKTGMVQQKILLDDSAGINGDGGRVV
jgi:uncharacterized protein (TIGR02678 family)